MFFHGGDLTFGSANFYDMSLLAADGSVVVVSVNYRLNLFGFLAARELADAERSNASGNLPSIAVPRRTAAVHAFAARLGR